MRSQPASERTGSENASKHITPARREAEPDPRRRRRQPPEIFPPKTDNDVTMTTAEILDFSEGADS